MSYVYGMLVALIGIIPLEQLRLAYNAVENYEPHSIRARRRLDKRRPKATRYRACL